jgi:hypothetical protein
VKKLFFVLLFIFLLRVPTFFEPYWYGDEGIYLAIGQAMQRGAVLYRDIWDNKPPLLYLIYSISPTLLWAKVSATLAVLATVTGVWKLTELVIDHWPLVIGFLSGTLLSVPLLEGTIANAELYFMTATIWGAYLLWNISQYRDLSLTSRALVGILMATAFLLKVPAVLDFVGLLLAFMIITHFESVRGFSLKNVLRTILDQSIFLLPVYLPFLLILGFVFTYFFLVGALPDFLTAVFGQNAAYVAIDSGPFSKLSNPLFVKAILLVISYGLLVISYYKKIISRELLFLTMWFGASLYGALLSNRPYLHYLLQIVPPAVILFFYLLKNIKKYWYLLSILVFIFYILYQMFRAGFALPTIKYYENWWQYITRQKTWESYTNWFDPRTVNNYQISSYLRNQLPTTNYQLPTLFVWGDNAFLYVLPDLPPATRFIQAHHLSTIDPVNYDLVAKQILDKKPPLILVVEPIRFPFVQLGDIVSEKYIFNKQIGDVKIYKLL